MKLNHKADNASPLINIKTCLTAKCFPMYFFTEQQLGAVPSQTAG